MISNKGPKHVINLNLLLFIYSNSQSYRKVTEGLISKMNIYFITKAKSDRRAKLVGKVGRRSGRVRPGEKAKQVSQYQVGRERKELKKGESACLIFYLESGKASQGMPKKIHQESV